ncbi:MAG: pentapeptide repeat-containing protein [Oceanospirillaceae bacterium]
MNGQNTASTWVPWVCIPLLFFLNFRIYTDYVSLNLTLLQIPVAVALTYRYGRHGFVAALIGAAPLLYSMELDDVHFGGRPALYIIIAHAAWLTLTNRWFNPAKSVSLHTPSMIFLLLACSIELDFDSLFNWRGNIVLYYAFFVFGLRDAQIRRWLVIAGLITFMGMVLLLAKGYYGFPHRAYLTESLSLSWMLNQPGDFLTLLVFFWMGKWIRAIANATTPSTYILSGGVKLAVSASILYLLSPMWPGLVAAVSHSEIHDSILYAISPAGSFYILPLLALLLSISRRNGLLITVALVGTYYMLAGFVAWSTDRYFSIDLVDFAIAITFAMLGTRIARQWQAIDHIQTASWLPAPFAVRQANLEPGEWKRQHDEISNTVRRVMLSLLAYALFCGLTLASSNDTSLFGVSSEIKLPIAGTLISYSTFLTVGPLIMVGLVVYLHLFLQSANSLGRPSGANPLPYLFNMDNPIAVALSGFLLYWLPVLMLFQFAWKATPQPIAGFWLGLASTGMGIVMVYLYMVRMPAEKQGASRWLVNVMFFIFTLLFAIQIASSGAILKRPLLLDQAPFEGLDLSGVDFRKASLKKADFKRTKLIGTNLRGADLSGAQFSKTDVKNADFRDVIGIGCDQFKLTINLETAYRDSSFSCGADIPQPLENEKKRGM